MGLLCYEEYVRKQGVNKLTCPHPPPQVPISPPVPVLLQALRGDQSCGTPWDSLHSSPPPLTIAMRSEQEAMSPSPATCTLSVGTSSFLIPQALWTPLIQLSPPGPPSPLLGKEWSVLASGVPSFLLKGKQL